MNPAGGNRDSTAPAGRRPESQAPVGRRFVSQAPVGRRSAGPWSPEQSVGQVPSGRPSPGPRPGSCSRPQGAPRLLLTAGEDSSDAHGAGLVRALRRKGFEGEITGIGGPALAAEGMHRIGQAEELAVVGLFEALKVVPAALRLLRRVKGVFRDDPPDLFVPIDSPDFNLRLLPSSGRYGVPAVYFIAPQLWAWRPGRVKVLRRHARELLVLFPFETDWFEQRGVPTTYVGHPLVDAARTADAADASAGNSALDASAQNSDRCEEDSPVRGLLLPGSRRGEIARHLPILAEAASRVARHHEIGWSIRVAGELDNEVYQPWAEEAGIRLSRRPLFELAREAQVAVCVSGTASFEVAITGTPVVVVYRMNALSWALAQRLVRVPFAAMANLTAGRQIVPELLQADCSPERIASEVGRLLDDPARRVQIREDLLGLRERFGAPGAYDRAAERVLAHLQPREP